jgi:pimeloyl-ACP methyl ester carboxylesterase
MRENAVRPGVIDRSPVLAILVSFTATAILAATLLLGLAASGSEPLISGWVLVALGSGWGSLAVLTARYSAQPQAWATAPAILLGSTGLLLIVFQPGPRALDALSWVWPPVLVFVAGWMVVQVRRKLRGPGRWLVMPMILALLLFAIGGGIVTVSAAAGLGVPTTSGRLTDVGGHRLYIECTGSGSPTVVLQSGLGESSSYWAPIARTVAESTTVCVYDRAGHGRSDEAAEPQDGIAVATDLHTLLERAGASGPYLLVGHSSGGPYMRVFAARFPDAVAGMVLLDAQPADAFTALPDYQDSYQSLRLAYGVGPSLARVGLLAIAFGLPADQATPAAARGARDELAMLPSVLQQAQALTSLGDRPLIVLTAGSGQQAGWLAAQDSMVSLSTSSIHRVVSSATHTSLISGPDAPASIQAILDVVASIRTGTVLR